MWTTCTSPGTYSLPCVLMHAGGSGTSAVSAPVDWWARKWENQEQGWNPGRDEEATEPSWLNGWQEGEQGGRHEGISREWRKSVVSSCDRFRQIGWWGRCEITNCRFRSYLLLFLNIETEGTGGDLSVHSSHQHGITPGQVHVLFSQRPLNCHSRQAVTTQTEVFSKHCSNHNAISYDHIW